MHGTLLGDKKSKPGLVSSASSASSVTAAVSHKTKLSISSSFGSEGRSPGRCLGNMFPQSERVRKGYENFRIVR